MIFGFGLMFFKKPSSFFLCVLKILSISKNHDLGSFFFKLCILIIIDTPAVWSRISWFSCAFPRWLMIFTISHVLFGLLYIFSGEMSTEVPCLFLKLGCLFYTILRIIYIYIWSANIFSQCMSCLLIPLRVPFDAKKVFTLMKSNLFYFFGYMCFWCHI